MEFYEQHLAIAREVGDRSGEGSALGNLGSAWADRGDARKAIEFYEQHLAIAREVGDRRGEGASHFNAADEYMKVGDAAAARTSAARAVAIYEALEHPSLEMARAQLARLNAQES